MKTWMAFCLVAVMVMSAPALASGDFDVPMIDEFGSNFTAQTPEALQDPPAMVMSAEELNEVTPAAGDSTQPSATQDNDILPVPETALVPGMEQTTQLPENPRK